MPTFLGVRYVWRTPARLQPGDELLLDDGTRTFVLWVHDEPQGTWLETCGDGVVIEAGYASGRYRVIT